MWGVSLLHDTLIPEFGFTQKAAGLHETSLRFVYHSHTAHLFCVDVVVLFLLSWAFHCAF